MAASPKYKIFTPDNEYVASVKYPSDAAAFVSLYPYGATIRLGHAKTSTVWTNGHEDFEASESYDRAVNLILARGEETN